MSKITPTVGTRGTFVLAEPWIENPGEIYEITAIRSLSELARSGVDPKKSIYAAMGLVDGSRDFVWANEEKTNPYILTLTGSAGNVITVPDTYITRYPDTSIILYHRGIISVDLGIFPEDEDLSSIAADMADLANSRTGMPASSKVHVVPLKTQPTSEQHLAYENVRKYNKPESISNHEELSLLKEELARVKQTNQALTKRLEALGVIT